MFASLVDLVCPRRCSGCLTAGRHWCAACATNFGTPFAADPSPSPAGLPLVLAAAAYDGPVRAALIAFKERGRISLAGPLGDALAAAVRQHAAEFIIAVPSSAAARHARGFDHVGLLAKRAAARTGAQLISGLRQSRRVADQSGLDSAGRGRNIAGSMRFAGNDMRGARVVVVDDIVTSGATLAEAARALRAAGATVDGAAVVAATARRDRLYKRAVSG